MNISKSANRFIDFILMFALLKLLIYASTFLKYENSFSLAFITWFILAWLYVSWRK